MLNLKYQVRYKIDQLLTIKLKSSGWLLSQQVEKNSQLKGFLPINLKSYMALQDLDLYHCYSNQVIVS